jgi:predicted transcriptional regulator
MPKPQGRLSPAQYEILQAIWEIGSPGATRMQIWARIVQERPVVRTTVLNLVDRLEARGWLERVETADGKMRFWPTAPRAEIEADVAADFVDCFFKGSASHLVMSLFGRRDIDPAEVDRLKEVLEEGKARRAGTEKRAKGKRAKRKRR